MLIMSIKKLGIVINYTGIQSPSAPIVYKRLKGIKHLIGFLMLGIMMLLSSISSYAATCDDVRLLVGREALDGESFQEKLKLRNQLGTELGKIDRTSENYNAHLDESYYTYESLRGRKEVTVERISILMQTDSYAPDMFEDIEELIEIDNRISNTFVLNPEAEVDLELTYTNLSEEVDKLEKNTNDKYNIGNLDNYWPVDSHYKKLKRAYGERIYIEDDSLQTMPEYTEHATWNENMKMYYNYEFNHSDSILIEAIPGQHVFNRFNGIVTESSQTDGISTIRVQSGKGLELVYRGKFNSMPNLGQRVTQNTILASVGINSDTIEIKALLDDTTINPCILFGSYGKEANNLRINSSFEPENYKNLIE